MVLVYPILYVGDVLNIDFGCHEVLLVGHKPVYIDLFVVTLDELFHLLFGDVHQFHVDGVEKADVFGQIGVIVGAPMEGLHCDTQIGIEQHLGVFRPARVLVGVFRDFTHEVHVAVGIFHVFLLNGMHGAETFAHITDEAEIAHVFPRLDRV